jgi:hypothetical protein
MNWNKQPQWIKRMVFGSFIGLVIDSVIVAYIVISLTNCIPSEDTFCGIDLLFTKETLFILTGVLLAVAIVITLTSWLYGKVKTRQTSV